MKLLLNYLLYSKSFKKAEINICVSQNDEFNKYTSPEASKVL